MGNSPQSNLNKPNTPGFQIFIFEEKWFYIPGNWIEGVVIIQLKKEVHANEISISLRGYSSSRIIEVWTTSYTAGTRTVEEYTRRVIRDDTYTVTQQHKKKYEDKLRILKSKLIVYNGHNTVVSNKKGESKNEIQHKLAAGLYLIPFRVQIPMDNLNIPGSHKGPDVESKDQKNLTRGTGSTFYWLEAVVEWPILKSNLYASKRLNIVPFVSVEDLANKFFEIDFYHRRCCCCLFTSCMGNQKTSVNIKMKAGVVMGEKLPLRVGKN